MACTVRTRLKHEAGVCGDRDMITGTSLVDETQENAKQKAEQGAQEVRACNCVM